MIWLMPATSTSPFFPSPMPFELQQLMRKAAVLQLLHALLQLLHVLLQLLHVLVYLSTSPSTPSTRDYSIEHKAIE
jgi:hypothetical protein